MTGLSLLLCGALAASAGQAAPAKELPRVLFLTHSAGFVHSVVKRPEAGGLSLAERRLVEAAEGRFKIVPSQDCALLAPQELQGFAAVVFYTSGMLPLSEEERGQFFSWIRKGGALVGVHSATDTWPEVPEYGALIGGRFDGHPWTQEVGVRVEDRAHPATRHLEERFTIADEIYQHRDFFRHPLRVLLSLDPDSVDSARGNRQDRDYALAWCSDHGEGRVFYTALGHREELFSDERFTQHLLGAIEWAINGPDYSPPPPQGAVVLIGNGGLSAWQDEAGGEALWRLEDGELEVVPGAGSILTREAFGDCLLHVEFMTPPSPEGAAGQGRGNSGVYLQGHYEVQVLDSYGLEPGPDDCGAIYGVRAPSLNASRPPLRWQAYDIRFRAPRNASSGEKAANARLSVWHNGICIQEDVDVPGSTRAAQDTPEGARGPLLLQDHGAPVRYRNVWLAPLPE
ncbi:MAG: ThuA domain-containing protein [Planctomycetes bacterium]|nr:ThuA domain-containing protein [Planctomycetota bacterium]